MTCGSALQRGLQNDVLFSSLRQSAWCLLWEGSSHFCCPALSHFCCPALSHLSVLACCCLQSLIAMQLPRPAAKVSVCPHCDSLAI